MKYPKPPTSIEEQYKLLCARGMSGNEADIKHHLVHANYYRLAAYAFTFRKYDHTAKVRSDDYIPGTSFAVVLDRYRFDRKLRLLVMDAMERIEVAIRTWLSYHHTHAHGAFAYYDDPASSLPKLRGRDLLRFMERIEDELDRARDHETFLKHFYGKYGDCHKVPPLWAATEVMSFRTLLTMYENCTKKVKDAVAHNFSIPNFILSSWLLSLNTIRNVCAHHGRLWNRQIGAQPAIPTGTAYRDWNTPVRIAHDRTFAVLTVINYCMQKVAPADSWATKFRALFDEHPNVPIKYMGFPPNWETSPLWNVAVGAGGNPHPGETNYPR